MKSPAMTTQYLTIAKSMRMVHGKLRPFIEVKAELDPVSKAYLLEHFSTETLFRRSAYTNGFADGGLQPSPPLSRMLSNFVKNDACPEITVKTLTSGQKYEGAGLWDIQCFDFIAKRSFDALCELAAGAGGFAKPEIYAGFGVEADLAAFTTDTALEVATVPPAIAVGGVQRMADAA
jgi:hypothetical protein